MANNKVEVTIGRKQKTHKSKPSGTKPEESEHAILWTNHVSVLLPTRKGNGKVKVDTPKNDSVR